MADIGIAPAGTGDEGHFAGEVSRTIFHLEPAGGKRPNRLRSRRLGLPCPYKRRTTQISLLLLDDPNHVLFICFCPVPIWGV